MSGTAVSHGDDSQPCVIAAWRTTDGRLGFQGGIERVTADADGLIRELRVLGLESDGA